jgi:hypothetical protein
MPGGSIGRLQKARLSLDDTLPPRRGPLQERHVVSPGVSPRFISGRLRQPLMPLVLHLLRQSRPACKSRHETTAFHPTPDVF